MTPFGALLIGLTTGGLTCLAVQGGLLLGLLARRSDHESTAVRRWQILLIPVGAFVVAKLISHTLLGFGLGWIGDGLQLSQTVKLWLQLGAGLAIIIAGIRLVKPGWFPWMNFTPPAAVRRFVRGRAKSELLFAPATLGFLTVLIPCGTTQAMEIAAISTGNPVLGAMIMFAFVLGTAPLFFLVGILAKGASFVQGKFAYAAAAVVIALGLYSMNGALIAAGSPIAIRPSTNAAATTVSSGTRYIQQETAQTIAVEDYGYRPAQLTVTAGEPVTLRLQTNETYSCATVFTIPSQRITKYLPPTGITTITTTFPKPGTYTFSCGMGMYVGEIIAI